MNGFRSRVSRIPATALAAAGVIAGIALVGPAGRVAAEAADHGHGSFVETDVLTDFCDVPGLDVAYRADTDENWLLRSRGNDGLYYFRIHASEVETWTNGATGKTFTIERTVNTREVKVTINADGTVTLPTTTTGHIRVAGPNGESLYVDNGNVTWEVLLDADLEVIDFLGITRNAGRDEITGRDFCADFLANTY